MRAPAFVKKVDNKSRARRRIIKTLDYVRPLGRREFEV
jgi:hypothetical protein